MPAVDDALGAEPRDELRRQRREHDHRPRVRQHPHAGGRRRVAEDELQVLRREEEEAEQGEEQHHDRAARRAEARVREQADVEQRLLGAALPADERDERDGRERAGAEDGGGGPALRRRLDDRPDEGDEAGAGERRAGPVEPARDGVARLGEEPAGPRRARSRSAGR